MCGDYGGQKKILLQNSPESTLYNHVLLVFLDMEIFWFLFCDILEDVAKTKCKSDKLSIVAAYWLTELAASPNREVLNA